MTGRDARQECVLNNVDWYRAVTRAHGLEGRIEHGVWTCRDLMPPYYSNAVTVSRSGIDAQLAHAERLAGTLARPFTIKDSHSLLDLSPLGFHVLFEAQWIRLAARAVTPRRDLADGWRRVTQAEALERWEAAWGAHGSPPTTRVFVPRLLADPAVAVLAAERDGEIVAGVVANRSPRVVGLSNVFGDDARFAGAVAAVRRFAPGMAVVGYESGEALERAVRDGFRVVGALRIWLCER
jgi:hypothetical protein